jgi:hypothetical protein
MTSPPESGQKYLRANTQPAFRKPVVKLERESGQEGTVKRKKRGRMHGRRQLQGMGAKCM